MGVRVVSVERIDGLAKVMLEQRSECLESSTNEWAEEETSQVHLRTAERKCKEGRVSKKQLYTHGAQICNHSNTGKE